MRRLVFPTLVWCACALSACDTPSAPAPPFTGALCEAPHGPLVDPLPAGRAAVFGTSGGADVEVGLGPPGAGAPDAWLADDALALDARGAAYEVTLFARVVDPRCADAGALEVRREARVAPAFAPAAGEPGSDAVAHDDPRVVGWATGWVTPVDWGADVDARWRDLANAVGPASTDPLDAVSLGNGGALVLRFDDPPIADGPGPDLAVFENAIDPGFLELARVEVSSDGRTFAAFGAAYLGDAPVDAFGLHDARWIGGLAGKYTVGWGTPFDLAALREHPAVAARAVDLAAIRFVRVVDVIGDGRERDSFGHPIYDPTPTVGSGGFDLTGVAVLRAAR